MKVVQVLYSGLGGHGSVAFSLITGDKTRTIDHHLIFYGIEPTRAEYKTTAERLHIPYRSILKKEGRNFKYWKAYKKALEEISPDIILLHSTNLIYPSIQYCKKHPSCQLISVEHQPNQIKRRSEWLWTKLSFKKSVKRVYLTDQYVQELSAKFGKRFRPNDVHVIGNGIDVERFSEVQKNSKDRFIITMQARFSETKNQFGLVKAFEQANLPPEAQLHLAGDGKEFEKVASYVKSSDLKNRIFLHGMLDEEGLIELLHETDLYVHYSIGETMSTAIMQAMSCGLPIIASDINGINNLISHGTTGLLFRNQEELTQVLKELYADDEKRKRLGNEASRVAREKFSNEVMFEKYMNLFQES